jgi:ribosomal protein S27E
MTDPFSEEKGKGYQPLAQPANGPIIVAAPADAAPALLSLQQTVFAPAEVVYCPICNTAYSAAGPRDGVRCMKCNNKVTLRPDTASTVFRCVECKNLLKTPYKSPTSGLLIKTPTTFPYDCPFCKKHNWFTFPAK